MRIGLWVGGVAVMAGLAGCVPPPEAGRSFSATVPGTGEAFAGTLAAPSGGARTFTMASSRRSCTGTVSGGRAGALAAFTCSDGRSGSFPVVVSGRGTAAGSIDGQALSVTF